MQREDFIFTIGYQGNAAIVDKRAKRQYGKLSTLELAEKGLYKSAFCAALYASQETGDDSEIEAFVDYYRKKSGNDDLSVDNLKRLFGVFGVPDAVDKLIQV
jgi:hypothetical protein